MSEVVVVTTEDLEPAVRLREGFADAGLGVEMLTSGEGLGDVPGQMVLLVLTGGLRERRAAALIRAAHESGRVPVIGLVESTEIASREACRRLGISECFPKPIDVEEVVLVGRRLVQRERLRELTGIIGQTDIMEEVLERVVQIASVDSTVLIQGESGTGKELVARGIHALSARRHRPFIAVNVAALPENLLEIGALRAREGRLHRRRLPSEGALRARPCAERSSSTRSGRCLSATQTKLLRVLEEREFRRVGGEDPIRVDVRVIAATNRNLRDQVELGEFRRDLYHRLNVLRIELPALRERKPDIPLLIHRFIQEFSRQHDRPFRGIEPEALEILVEYAWPGNVRELRNLVESMVVLAPGRTIRPEDIPVEVRFGRSRSLLPVLARPRGPEPESGGAGPAEMEFILRTLFDLKVDVDDLRRELDGYRQRQRREIEVPLYPSFPSLPTPGPVGQAPEPEAEEEPAAGGAVVFRPGHDDAGPRARGHRPRPPRGGREPPPRRRDARHRRAHALSQDQGVRSGGVRDGVMNVEC